LAGDINAGTANGGYQFSIFGAAVSSALGGIATAAGGDVTLQAGDDIISVPTVPANQPPGASGAYGSQPGDVTLIAGNQVVGNFTVANGTGTILAGAQVNHGQGQILNAGASVGTSTHPVELSLIDGSWNVWSGGNVYVGEVRNPNGTFNGDQLTVPNGVFAGNIGSPNVPTRSSFLFNYAPNAAANFWAGDAIVLAGANLPRVQGENGNMPPVYPPVLTLNAGSGGITVDNPVILYPSSQGALQITTRDGGNLTGAQQQNTLVGITMSDSALPGYATFAQGQALTPLYLHNPNPVAVNISGDINSFGLTVPTFANINVNGGTYNFGFLGQNLSPAQTTSINVTGAITYRGDTTSVPLTAPLPPALFNPALSTDPSASGLLTYNATSGTLTFIGQMTASDLAFLLNPTQYVLNSAGQPEVNAGGVPITKPIVLNAAQQAALQQLYTASQSATLGDNGLALAGPGQFSITASSMDLGISGGITVLPPNTALAAISPDGAKLTISVANNLDMTSTQIANESYLGAINMNIGGVLDVGGQYTTFGDPNAPKGIFTTSGGAINVTAGGDINVDGSRIATYDGGNISILSQNGDVNAGSGGAGYVSFNALEVNAKTGQLTGIPATVPGSGILATTVVGSDAGLGNITVDTPHGSINASLGGILQIAFNGTDSRNSFIDLTAGQNINASGSGVIGANIKLQAGGNITGVVLGTQSVDINSQQNVSATVVSGGNVDISAGGGVTGTVVGGGSVNVSGESITAALMGGSVSTSGQSAGASIGVPQSNVARDDSRGLDDAATNTASVISQSLGKELGGPGKVIALAQKTGRVTVVLPAKK